MTCDHPPSVDVAFESWDGVPLSSAEVTGWLAHFWRELALPPCEVSVLLADDERLHALNRAYRQQDKPTDVLSFPQIDGDPQIVTDTLQALGPEAPLGDIAISWQQIALQAEEHDEPPRFVLARLLAHGALHLFGYDHQTPEETAVMQSAEDRCLGTLATEKTARHGPS